MPLSTNPVERLFLRHPRSVGETYLQHLRHAFSFGLRLLAAGCACVVHGLVPALFVHTGSRTVAQLHERMIVQRRTGAGPPPEPAVAALPCPGQAPGRAAPPADIA